MPLLPPTQKPKSTWQVEAETDFISPAWAWGVAEVLKPSPQYLWWVGGWVVGGWVGGERGRRASRLGPTTLPNATTPCETHEHRFWLPPGL